MSEKEEKLSQSDQEKIKQWISKNNLNTCLACKKSSSYILMDEIIQITGLSNKVYYPTLLIICLECGRHTYFSAVAPGIDLGKYGVSLLSEPEKENSDG